MTQADPHSELGSGQPLLTQVLERAGARVSCQWLDPDLDCVGPGRSLRLCSGQAL